MWHECISNVATQGDQCNLARWVKIMQNHQGKIGHCGLYEKQFILKFEIKSFRECVPMVQVFFHLLALMADSLDVTSPFVHN